MCSQRAAEMWVSEMARKHGFKMLSGVYPTLQFEKEDLDQVIREVSCLREEMFTTLNVEPNSEEGEFERKRWNGLVDRLVQLKSEDGWLAHFG